MNQGAFFYILGTLLYWVGLFFALRALYLLGQMRTEAYGIGLDKLRRSLLVSAVTAGGSLLVSSAILLPVNHRVWYLPLVWVVMPFTGWLALASVAAGVARLLQAAMAGPGEHAKTRLLTSLGWFALAAISVWFYKRDPSDTIAVLKGGIAVTPQVGIGLAALAVAAVVAMVMAGKSVRHRGWTKTAALQFMLLVGSVLFGIPFVWLVITSFKEDVDMANPNGIVWVPKVQQTVKFMSPDDPLYQGKYKGDSVVGDVQSRNSDGTLTINVVRPEGLAGVTFDARPSELKQVPSDADVVRGVYKGQKFQGFVMDQTQDGRDHIKIQSPPALAGTTFVTLDAQVEKVRHIGLKWTNYPEALDFLPEETDKGLVYLKNTLYLVVLSVIGTLLSSSIVAYAFSRMRFPGKEFLFKLMLSTMMLPAAVTMLPQFLIFRSLGWIDTLRPLWVPAFLGSAFNVFLLRQFLLNIPMELEDAAKIDGCTYLKTFWAVMLPQIKPALAVIGIWTFMGAWNNFMGPLIYISSPEHMTIPYAVQMYNGDRSGEPGLLMAFTTLSMLPVMALFFFAQKYFIEGVTLSGLGGR